MAKRGRPAFKVTSALQRKVAELTSCGMSEDDVARALGCATETLRKHFPEELLTGRAVKRAEVITMLFATARKGNVSAQKHLEAMTGAATAAGAGDGAKPPVSPGRRLGKKEAARIAADNPDPNSPLGALIMERAATETKPH